MEQKPTQSLWIDEPFTALAGGLQNLVHGFVAGITDTTKLYVDLINIKKENAQLLQSKNEISTRLEIFNEIQQENDRLRSLLDFKQSHKLDLKAAVVIGKDLWLDQNRITINKGSEDGLKHGQAVVTTQGVVGHVYRPQKYVSQVMLITDRYSVVDAIVQRSRSRGIVEGKNDSKCLLKYIDSSDNVKVGDIVVTGGLDNIFPKGFPIATIESVERKTFSVALKVELKPFVDVNKVEEVFVITNANHQDLVDQFVSAEANSEEPQSESDNKPSEGTSL